MRNLERKSRKSVIELKIPEGALEKIEKIGEKSLDEFSIIQNQGKFKEEL